MMERSYDAAVVGHGHAPRRVHMSIAALKRQAARRIALPAIIGVLATAFVLHASGRASAVGLPTVPVTVPTVPTVPVNVPTVPVAVPTVTVVVTASGSGAGVKASAGTGGHGPSASASASAGTHGASAGATVSAGTVGTSPSSAAPALTGSGGSGSPAQTSGSSSGGSSGTATGSRSGSSHGAGSPGAAAPVTGEQKAIGAALGLAEDITPRSTSALLSTRRIRHHGSNRGSATVRRRQASRNLADPRARSRPILHRPARARRAAGTPEPTQIYRKGNNYYYVKRLPDGRYSFVVVQVPLSRSAGAVGSSGNPTVSSSSPSSRSLPSEIPAVVARIARGILNGVVAGGGGMGRLIGTDFPLVPALLGLILLGAGLLLRGRRFRFAGLTQT